MLSQRRGRESNSFGVRRDVAQGYEDLLPIAWRTPSLVSLGICDIRRPRLSHVTEVLKVAARKLVAFYSQEGIN